MPQVAIITGGGRWTLTHQRNAFQLTSLASGMGLAVAHALAKREDWIVHLLDINQERGTAAAADLGSNVHFHQTNVTSYASLAQTFDRIFSDLKRVDFVFANAGGGLELNFEGSAGQSFASFLLNGMSINLRGEGTGVRARTTAYM